MAQPSEQFSGDMSRNEVEIDLNKFMAMVSEIGELINKESYLNGLEDTIIIESFENGKIKDNYSIFSGDSIVGAKSTFF